MDTAGFIEQLNVIGNTYGFYDEVNGWFGFDISEEDGQLILTASYNSWESAHRAGNIMEVRRWTLSPQAVSPS